MFLIMFVFLFIWECSVYVKMIAQRVCFITSSLSYILCIVIYSLSKNIAYFLCVCVVLLKKKPEIKYVFGRFSNGYLKTKKPLLLNSHNFPQKLSV